MENLKINNQKGITLIALSITIIILLILAGITINMGKNGIQDSKEDAKLSELGMIQNAVLQRKTKADLTKEEYPGETILEAGITLESVINEINSNVNSENTITRKDSNDEDYYLLSNENSGLRELGITNSEDEYIVNYETGEVFNYTEKVTKSGKPLYIYARELN